MASGGLWANWGSGGRPAGGGGIGIGGFSSGPDTVTDPPSLFPGVTPPQTQTATPSLWPTTGVGWAPPPGFYYGGKPPSTGSGGNGQIPDLSDYLQRQNWQIAYDVATQGAGLSPQGAFAGYVRSQQDLLQRAYNQALTMNADLTPQQFLAGYGGVNGLLEALQQKFQALPYQLRGEDPRQWGQGVLGWVGRNN